MIKLNLQVSGDGPNLVLIHGWAMSSLVWGGWLKDLEKSYRVIRVELPGHGCSQHHDDWEMNELLEAMAAQFPQVCTVLGWSLGGMVALAYASKYQERVERLIMLASSAKFVQSSDWQHAQTEETLSLFIRGAKDNMSATIKRFVSLQTQGVKQQKEEAVVLKGFVVGAINESKKALISGLLVLQNSDLRHALRDLNCPLLMMLGEKDQLVPKGVATDSMMINEGVQLCVIEGAAHVPFLSHPKESLRVLQQFMLSERGINDE